MRKLSLFTIGKFSNQLPTKSFQGGKQNTQNKLSLFILNEAIDFPKQRRRRLNKKLLYPFGGLFPYVRWASYKIIALLYVRENRCLFTISSERKTNDPHLKKKLVNSEKNVLRKEDMNAELIKGTFL